MKQNLFILIFLFLVKIQFVYGLDIYPHILVCDQDRQNILNKIKEQSWASFIFEDFLNRVIPYVERHKKDPEWILSRYQMNWIAGKRYTHAYADNAGQGIINYAGDAPVPTVRIPTWLRTPITEKGSPYRKPTIEELIPYDTSKVMLLFNPETNQREWIDPQAYVTSINADINNLALEAAIIYWLFGDEKYAHFTADILDQWAKGVYYQEPIIGPGRTGLIALQTLDDAAYQPLILAYDFVKPYMKEKKYDLHWYEVVFEKFASTMAYRGFWNNNWYAAESSTLVFAALSLENIQKKEYYLQFFLDRDTVDGPYGQLALPSTVGKWLTPDGHWKEPSGYHNYAVENLLISSIALEKNGYEIFSKFPSLLKASYVLLKYSFPNLTLSAFGDTGRASQSGRILEMGIIGAMRGKFREISEMVSGLHLLIKEGKYRREQAGYIGLLCFPDKLPNFEIKYEWPRTGALEFARYFLQRNKMESENGLMVGVQGATYNHNHCNGMAMELYGVGEVMGVDPGTGPNYEHPLHQNYYSQWAAHNTVVAAGSSSSKPFKGGAGAKDIGVIELEAMEPMPEENAVSSNYSFTDTRYFDKSTNTHQSRTLGIIRVSDKIGYYIDIFRSDNSISNDYVYHNVGHAVALMNDKRIPISMEETTYPITKTDYPGFRFFKEVNKLENYTGNIIACFSGNNEKGEAVFMQVLIGGADDRTYYQAFSPEAKTAGKQYKGKYLPVFTIRTEKEAQTTPFILIFEPYKGEDNFQVDRISIDNGNYGRFFTSLKVFLRDGSYQQILQSVDPKKRFISETCSFSGYYAVAGYCDKKLQSLYLGNGSEISIDDYALKTDTSNGSADMVLYEDFCLISCNQPTTIKLAQKEVSEIILIHNGEKKNLSFKKVGNGIIFKVPEVKNGRIQWM